MNAVTPVDRRRALAAALRDARVEIAKAATDEFLGRHPDWVDRYGAAARRRGEEDAGFHVDFLAGALLLDEPAAFVDYARWAAGVLAARKIASEFLAENLEQVGRAAEATLEPAAAETVRRFVAEAVGALRSERDHSPRGAAVEAGPLDRERRLYLRAVLSGERRAALGVALEAVRAGASVLDVYAHVLQPTQYELGRLWERTEITVATEHMATAISQYVVSQLYGHLEIPEPTRGRGVLTGIEGELHQLGANMVADVLEADGWNVRFLGTQMPHAGILHALDEHDARLLGISATVLSNLTAVASLIDDARRLYGSELTILVGGRAFRSSPNAWQDLGADGYGSDLREAVATAARLTSARS